MSGEVQLYVDDALGRYGFPHGHPFGPDRQDAFWKEAEKQGLPKRVALRASREAKHDEIERFLTTNLNEEKAANTKLNTVALRKGVNAKASTAA